MMLKSTYPINFNVHFSIIVFLASKFDFYNVLTNMPSNLNPNSGTELLTLARNKENDSN